MKIDFHHKINHHPKLEDVGKIIINARIFCEDDTKTFKTSSLLEEFINEEDDRRIKEEWENFLIGARISEDDIASLDDCVDLILTCLASDDYSLGCLLVVWLDLVLYPNDDYYDDDFDDLDDDDGFQIEEIAFDDDFNDEEEGVDGVLYADDSRIEEQVAQVSFDETRNIRLRPASKLVVKSLARKIYDTKTKKEETKNSLEECTLCLKEFSNGARLVTLPCGHDFHDECLVKWLEVNHFCPLCRLKLPCDEDQ